MGFCAMNTISTISRRLFAQTGLAGALYASAPAMQTSRAGEILRLGVIGCGNRGRYDVKNFLRFDGVEVTAICDPDPRQMDAMMAESIKDRARPKRYADFRELLDRQDIDMVLIATPDHWHALPFIEACKAGKDVYCEKPAALTIYEGRQMVNAARKYNRITQIGTQQRSNPHYKQAREIILGGVLGQVTHIECWNVSNRLHRNMGSPPDCAPPEGVDYNMWLGPAPKRAFNPNRFHGSWRWFWDYSGGQVTDWGTHHMDIVQWFLDRAYPKTVCMSGGKFALEDNGEMPDTTNIVWEYDGDATVHYFNRMCSEKTHHGKVLGIKVYGSEATLFIDRGGFEVKRITDGHILKTAKASDRTDVHIQNFLDGVRSRERCISDVEVTHRSTSAVLLANIAYHADEKLHWDGENEKIVNHPQVNSYLKRPYREPWNIAL
ncbi:gfo/Idh/MocA family oxidoreductase [bacterium]|nr:gfo/Idh/MocA family oxidoreductase [bacterium]